MPQPRRHGGAELIHIPLVTPGFRGLNKQQAGSTLTPEWATELVNAAVDDAGRLSARNGWLSVTTSALAAQIRQVGELVKSDATTELVAFTATTCHKSSNGGASWSDITGTVTFTAGNWALHNFNNAIYGFQSGEAPVYYTGTGNLTQVSDVNAPTGGVGCSAYGRIWSSTSTGHELKYSALLDGTDWTSADSGVIDMWNIWPGNDQITAVAAFNGLLAVFGKNCIVLFTDGQGSTLGVDPTQMYVVDVIQGVGCLSQFSIQEINGDLWFLSANGLQSLGRVIQSKSNPLENLSKNVRDWLNSYISGTTLTNLRSAYSPRDRLFLLSLSSGGSAETGTCIAFDTRGIMEDGTARCLGQWTLVPTAVCVKRDQTMLISRIATLGEVGSYTGSLDDTETYSFEYNSGWIDLTQQGYLLIPKRYEGVFFSESTVSVVFKWAFDFSDSWYTGMKSFSGSLAGGEWGLAEWGLSEFGGGVGLREGNVPARGTGQYIKLGLSVIINNTSFANQKLTLFSKIGRLS